MGNGKVHQPAIEMKGKEIRQIGIVVKDAPRTAKRYSELLGIGPWIFLDGYPADTILHDAPAPEACCIRLALANLGRIQVELIQPIFGPSTHMEFLRKQGEGIHHISFGRVDDHDEMVRAFQEGGIGIEMQGLLGGTVTFTYMATQKEFGTILEFLKPPPRQVESTLKPWGTYAPHSKGLIDLGGKEVAQIGIVVEDAEEKARRYWDTLGIGPWLLVDFKRPHVRDEIFHGISMTGTETHVKAALANFGNMQLELLEPVCGPGTHMDFLNRRGQGVHHVSFGEVADHDEMLCRFREQGISIEMTGLLGGAATFTYLATQKDLGTIFEMVKIHPGVQNTIVPYGTIGGDR